MNVIQMLKALKEGKIVKHKYWCGTYIRFVQDKFLVNQNGDVVNLNSIIDVSDKESLLEDCWQVVTLPPDILDKEEKEYLSSFLKPYAHNYPIIITKRENLKGEYLTIEIGEDVQLDLPTFKQGLMYKNMKVRVCYTTKDLRLFTNNN